MQQADTEARDCHTHTKDKGEQSGHDISKRSTAAQHCCRCSKAGGHARLHSIDHIGHKKGNPNDYRKARRHAENGSDPFLLLPPPTLLFRNPPLYLCNSFLMTPHL